MEVKRPEGFYVRLHVPETFTKWDALKVGSAINVSYYENVVLKIERPGAALHGQEAVAPPKTSAAADGTSGLERLVTATISEVDMKLGTVSFSENGRLVARYAPRHSTWRRRSRSKTGWTDSRRPLSSS